MGDLVVTKADLGLGRLADIRLAHGRIQAIGAGLGTSGADRVLDAGGAAVVPGLHDHHVHLLAAAAAERSLDLGGDAVAGHQQLAETLQEADRRLPEGAWLRGVGYHDGVAGPIDRWMLDAVVPHRPVKIQHRSGHQWVVNTPALEAVTRLAGDDPGIERDGSGSPTGRLQRMDRVIDAAGRRDRPCLEALSERAARAGVTGFTDATPVDDVGALWALAEARAAGRLVQRTTVMTGPHLEATCPDGLVLGPVKLMLDEAALPGLEELCATVVASHRAKRNVAVHCVTRSELVLTVAALEVAGPLPGDRIEHGALIPAELLDPLRRLQVVVVTNPGFLFERGDDYLVEVAAADRDDLYRCASLMASGVPVAAGTDAPFGPADPWLLVRTAVGRRSRSGQVLGAGERLEARLALSLLLGSGPEPGVPRRLAVGAPGDLCVLSTPLDVTLAELDGGNVAATVVAGEVVADNR